MVPFWVGIVWLMGRRSEDGRYVDVTHKGIIITSPTERLSLPASEIDRVDYSRIRQRLSIRAGKRSVRIKGVIEAQKTPSKVSLVKWLSAKAPLRREISNSMLRLKESIEELVAK
jgi:hypothetical protein